jgi:hypothetical protein
VLDRRQILNLGATLGGYNNNDINIKIINSIIDNFFELRALCLQSRCSTALATLPVHFAGYFGDESHELFATTLPISASLAPSL